MSATVAELYRQYRQWPRPNPAATALYFARREWVRANLPTPKLFPSMTAARVRSTMLTPSPVVHAETDSGEVIAMSFYQAKGKPWDYARAQELIAQCLAADVRYGGACRLAKVTKFWLTWKGHPVSQRELAKAKDALATKANRAFLALEQLLPHLPPEAMKVRGALYQLSQGGA